jgi:hypothetical protein
VERQKKDLAALLYSYAINKISANPPEKGAEILIVFAIVIYVISLLIKVFYTGGHN